MIMVMVMMLKMMMMGEGFFFFLTHTWMLLFIAGRRPGRRVQPQVQLLLRRPSRGAARLLRRPHLVRYRAADFAREACASDSLPSSGFHSVACGLAQISLRVIVLQSDTRLSGFHTREKNMFFVDAAVPLRPTVSVRQSHKEEVCFFFFLRAALISSLCFIVFPLRTSLELVNLLICPHPGPPTGSC